MTLIGCQTLETFSPRPDKLSLWENQTGPHLRGAVVYQRRYYSDLGDEPLGGPFAGPPLTQQDFDDLAKCGANAVVLSHPGLFAEKPPYAVDEHIVQHLDAILKMIENAGLFAIIAVRTGPGRSEFTFVYDDVNTWFGPDKLNDQVWATQGAQDAWVAMWRFIAERYKNNRCIVGYELMVEPNSNAVGSDVLSSPIDIYDPDQFYQRYAGTLYDWNQLHPKIVRAIREVDTDTPILLPANGYSSAQWLPYISNVSDQRVVFAAHQYEPHEYTHQKPEAFLSYPGEISMEDDGNIEAFNSSTVNNILRPVSKIVHEDKATVAVTEFGTVRWAPGANLFLANTMDVLEKLGINYFVYEWGTRHMPYLRMDNAFFFEVGPDPKNTAPKKDNELMLTICDYWRRNSIRLRRNNF